jgi:hypothetical protein
MYDVNSETAIALYNINKYHLPLNEKNVRLKFLAT